MGTPLFPQGEGLTKYCSWDGWYQDGHVKVPYVRKVATNGNRFAKIAKFECGDTSELVRQFIEEYQVKVGHTYLLDTALGAYEAWGSNNNGDAWRESDLIIDSDDRGYRSFQKHAMIYRHHKNQNPAEAMGKVVLAAYNKDMRRVEIIEELNNLKAGDLLQKWANEGSLPTSMGGKVPYDECSICGNRAASASKYCDHAKYAMNRITDDGRKICVFNPNMKFFDQSHVIIPAEKIAGTMMKVASDRGMEMDIEEPAVVPSAVAGTLRNSIEIWSEKTAEQHVEVDDLTAAVRELAERDKTLPLEMLQTLAEYPLHKVAATMTYLGIVPKPEEWQYLVLSSHGDQKTAAALHADNICFDPDSEELPEHTEDDAVYLAPEFASPEIARKLAAYIPERSVLPQFLGHRMEKTAAEHPIEIARKGSPSIPATMAALGVSYGLMRAIQGANKDAILGISRSTGVSTVITSLLIAAGFAAALRAGSNIMSSSGGKQTEKTSSFIEDPELERAMGGEWGAKVSAQGTMGWIANTPDAIKGVVVPFGAGYMTSAYYRAKQMQGQPTTNVQNVVADHPLAVGIGATGAVALARRALRK